MIFCVRFWREKERRLWLRSSTKVHCALASLFAPQPAFAPPSLLIFAFAAAAAGLVGWSWVTLPFLGEQG